MNAIDELLTQAPVHGTRKLRHYLREDYGFQRLGRDRVRRLLRETGNAHIQAFMTAST